MELPLTVLVLRSGVTPANAFTESFRGAIDLQLWSAGHLERIQADDVELTLTARPDECNWRTPSSFGVASCRHLEGGAELAQQAGVATAAGE
jgi:hypothetical protein